MDEIIEISRSKLALLEGTAKLANDLWNDPDLGPQVKEATKQKYPQANIPEVDMLRATRKAESEILAKVEETKKETFSRIEAFEKSQKDREEKDSQAKAEKDFAGEIEETKSKYKLTAEGMEKVFARMKEKNNPDMEAAAAWVTDHEPKESPQTSSPYAPQSFDLYGSQSGDKEWEALNRNPLKFGEDEMARMANDFSNGNFSKYKEWGGSL